MDRPKCPGQDQRYWKPEDIYDITCPYCKSPIEFWKDEPVRVCSKCRKEVRNPKIDLGCAKWCKYARECLGVLADQTNTVGSVCDRIVAGLRNLLVDQPDRLDRAMQRLAVAEKSIAGQSESLLIVKAVLLLADIDVEQARQVLLAAAIPGDEINQVCGIIHALQAGETQTSPEFQTVQTVLKSA